MSRKDLYKKFSISYRDSKTKQFRNKIKDVRCNDEELLQFYTENIPLWEVYLTELQCKAVKLFLSTGNTREVDRRLGLNNNAWTMLFSKTSGYSVLCKLQNIYEEYCEK